MARLVLSLAGGAFLFTLAVFFLGAGLGFVFSFVNPPVSSLMLERYLAKGAAPGPRVFIPLDTLPAGVPVMFVRLEDKRFYEHPGVDPAAIKHAFTQNRRWKRVIMGGSTITQQTVRSLFLSPDRTYLRKYAEAVAAVGFDLIMDKRRIMELYLNYIEWGKGVYGIGAAARHHYQKPATRLTHDEYARLAAIIVNPIRWDVRTLFEHGAMAARYHALTAPPGEPEPAVEKAGDEAEAGAPEEETAVEDAAKEEAVAAPAAPVEEPPPSAAPAAKTDAAP